MTNWLKILKNLRNKFEKTFVGYDYRKYWKRRGENYDTELKNRKEDESLSEQERIMREFFKNNTFESALEVGCGTGRILKVVEPYVDLLYGMDISEHQVERAKKYADKVVQGDIVKSLVFDRTFDLVYTVTVLQHIPDTNISQAIENIKKLSDRTIVHLEICSNENPSSKHMFSHKYEQFYDNYNFEVRNVSSTNCCLYKAEVAR